MIKILRNCFVVFLLAFSVTLCAEIPDGYYDNADGKAGEDLKTALYNIINNHKQQGYYASSYFFERYDLTPDNYIWDMYSNDRYTQWSGSGMNREHCMPKSWFGISSGSEDSKPIGCDYHNLYPSNAAANSAKSNYPLGTTDGASFNNGVSKVGKSTFSGNNGTVFEPADEYKGDFARSYMYMVTRYENYGVGGADDQWTNSTMLTIYGEKAIYPTFNEYAIELLMTWHRADIVSEKEINRNNAVYSLQNNRNPFIDNPDFAELIWGNLSGEGEVSYPNRFNIYYPDGIGNQIEIIISNREESAVYYQIYSVSGLRMLVGELSDDGIVSLNGISDGMYILVVYSGNERYADRFFINSK